MSSELTLISDFFLKRWDQPVSSLLKNHSDLFYHAGICLQSLGRLEEAKQAMTKCTEKVELAVIDKKGLGKHKQKVIQLLEKNKIKIKKI